MKKFILIWWPPTTGKSTLAQHLAKALDLPWFSTDQIRSLLKVYAEREETWWLFLPKWYDTAETFLERFSVEEIVDMEFAQAFDVYPWVKVMLDDSYSYVNWCIIEWVNITPEIIHTYLQERDDILPIIVIDENLERIRETVYSRWLFDAADTYDDTYKEKEVEWVELFLERTKKDCEKYGISCVSIEKNESDTEKILSLVNSHFN